eukprot:960103-Prymnesium_polylepis.2
MRIACVFATVKEDTQAVALQQQFHQTNSIARTALVVLHTSGQWQAQPRDVLCFAVLLLTGRERRLTLKNKSHFASPLLLRYWWAANERSPRATVLINVVEKMLNATEGGTTVLVPRTVKNRSRSITSAMSTSLTESTRQGRSFTCAASDTMK